MIIKKFIMILSLACAASLCADTNTIQYVDDFEGYTNGTVLNDTNHWYGSTNAVMVQTNVHASGSTRSAIIPSRASLSNSFHAASSTNLWMGMDVIVDYYDDSLDNPPVWVDGNAQLYVSTSGYFVVYNAGYGWQVLSNDVHGVAVDPVPSNDWVRVDVRLDYAQRQWRLDVNGRVMATGLHFIATGPELFSGLEVYSGGNSTSYLDNVFLYDTDAMPQLTVVPNAFTNTVVAGYAVPTQFLDVVSTGDGEIDYQIEVEYGSPWLEVSSVGGSLTNNMTNQVWVTYLTNNLAPGANADVLRFVSSDWGGMTQEVAVVVNLNPLHVDPGPDMVIMQGAAAQSTLTVTHSGAGSYDYTLTPTVPWLSILPDTGVVGAATNTHTLHFVTTSLAPGAHTAGVRLESHSHGGVTQAVAVTVGVMKLELAPPLISWEIPRGATITNSKTFEVWNAGTGIMDFNVTAAPAWVSITPTNGTSSGPGLRPEITVGIAGSAGFEAGTHTGRVKVTAQDPQGYVATQTVAVLVNVIEPSAPHWLRATDGIYTNMVRVEWSATAGAVSYELRRGVVPDIGSAAALATVSAPVTVYDDLTAAAGRQYYYWVRAVNAYGYAGSYSLMDGGWRRLSPPPGLTATRNDADKVRVEWSTAAGWPAGYEVWRNESGGSGLRVGVTTGLQFDDAQATPGVRYYYWLRATNSLGKSASGPLAEGLRRLGQVQASASEGDYPDRVRVSWAAVAGAQGYEVWRSGGGGESALVGSWVGGVLNHTPENSAFSLQPSAFASLVTVTGRSYDDRAVVFGEGYAYRVRAVSSASTGEFSQAATGWLAPAAISELRAGRGLHTHHVRVSWEALEGALDYELQRSPTEDFAAPQVLTVLAGLQFDDATAVPGRQYYYRAKARRGNLYWYSLIDSGWRRLSPPAGVSASQGGFPVGIHVSWPAAEGADYYEVWSNNENDVFNATLKAQVSGLEWVDGSASLGMQRYYWVRARSAVDVSDYSFSVWGRAAMTVQLGGPDYLPLKGDFDGDGLADPAVYNAAAGIWRVLMSSAAYAEVSVSGWGGPGWQPVPVDYDGDGRADPAVYREADGGWRVWLSGSGYAQAQVSGWGGPGWQPVPLDYDGDGRADPAVYDASTGAWRVWLSGSGYAMVEVHGWGGPDWGPVPADYDGDGRADPAVYRALDGAWQVWLSGANYARTAVEGWGGAGWLPVAGDFDGDGKVDPAVYREADGGWSVWLSDSGYRPVTYDFGGPDYMGLALDFHGTGISIPVIYNPTDGVWWIRNQER